jgi:hypothetical protein
MIYPDVWRRDHAREETAATRGESGIRTMRGEDGADSRGGVCDQDLGSIQ